MSPPDVTTSAAYMVLAIVESMSAASADLRTAIQQHGPRGRARRARAFRQIQASAELLAYLLASVNRSPPASAPAEPAPSSV